MVKADVQGSLDAIETALEKFSTAGVKAKVVAGGVGDVAENDVMMASTASKLVIAFNVQSSPSVKQFAKAENVKISSYRVIYELLDDIKAALEGLLPPIRLEITQGKLDVLQVFSISKKLTIAGGKVTEGKVEKGATAKIMRKDEEIAQIKISSVHKGKDEVPSCQIGTECGLGIDGKVEILAGDSIIAFTVEEQKQTIDVII